MGLDAIFLFAVLWFAVRYLSVWVMLKQRKKTFNHTMDEVFETHFDKLTEFLATGFQMWLPASIVASVYAIDSLLSACVVIMIGLGILAAYEAPVES